MALSAQANFLRMSVVAAAVAMAAASHSTSAGAEAQLSAYGGWNGSFDSDVDLVQPGGGTNMTLTSVPWKGKSFSGPIYYGLRGTYWFDSGPHFGVAVDFSHAKIKAEMDKTVRVAGRRDGGLVGGRETVGTTFNVLEFTDGLNLVLLNAMYRWPNGQWTPYAGVGLGVAIPHVEVWRTARAIRTFEYQVTGLAAQALAGVELVLSDRWAAFGEYKISYAQVDADLSGGGSLQTDVWTNHVLFGLTYRLRRRAPAGY